jgi:transposase
MEHNKTKAEQVNFEGQHFYVGIDVHKKSWKVNIRNCGISLKFFSIDPSPEMFYRHLKKNYPGGTYHIVYEAGFSGFWIQRQFSELGIHCIVVNPADVPTSHKEKDRKSDVVDAYKLARELEKGELKPIYVPEESQQHLRSLCRLYGCITQNSTRTKNRIKGLLAYNGISVPHHSSHWSAAFIDGLRNIPLDKGPARDYLTFCLDELLEHRARKLKVLKKLRSYVSTTQSYNTIKYIRSIHGIGFITAITLFTEITDMKRFPSFDKLKAFVGLIPSCHSSGEKDVTGSLSPRKNPHLRYVLIEAAWVAVGKDPVLLAAYHKLIARMKKQDAIIRIAAKLLCHIRYVWLHSCAYPYTIA